MDEFVQFASAPIPETGPELNLKNIDERIGTSSLLTVNTNLDRLFGKDVWLDWEPETISLELNQLFDTLAIDKIRVLQILRRDPSMFYDDSLFMLYATEVINNNEADFEMIPSPTVLELCFAFHQVDELYKATGQESEASDVTAKTLAWALRHEGYSKVPTQLQGMVPDGYLEEGRTEEDSVGQQKAADMYIRYMEQF
jgi:hypothetical protein